MALWLERHCPWSGIEDELAGPTEVAYAVWFRVYRLTQVLSHRVGVHAWRAMPLGGDKCDWCGFRRQA